MADARLMLHLNGTDAATSTVDATGRHPTITFNGTAQISTGSVKTGTANLLVDGDSDYLSIPASEDWNICAVADEDWTIDLLVKHADHDGVEYYVSQWADSSSRWMLLHQDGAGLKFFSQLNGITVIDTGSGGEIDDQNWHHVALCKVGDKYGLYKDGIQVAYVQDSSRNTVAAPLTIGASGSPTYYFDGRIDELRIDKSNHFSAAPNVGLTDRIVVLHSVAHYKLDDDAANTTIADASGNGYTAALAGGDDTEDINIVGQVDGALQFDGTNDYVDTGDPFESIFQGSFSISCLVRPDDGQPAGGSERLFSVNDTAGGIDRVTVRFDTAGRVAFDYYSDGDGGNIARTNAAVFADGPAATWTHIVCVADSTVGGVGGKKIYIDGSLADLDAIDDGDTALVIFADYISTLNPYIGARNNDGGTEACFDGGLDDVILFNKTLTQSEVTALYNDSVDGKSAADAEYEAYELLPEFPTLTFSPQAMSWSEQMDAGAVKGSGYASGMPLIDEQYTFAPVHFKHVIEGLTNADKATFDAFYLAYKGRTILWLNTVDSLNYQVQFKRPPKIKMMSPGLWRIDMEIIQVNSQTVS